jgi:hypothetical protein
MQWKVIVKNTNQVVNRFKSNNLLRSYARVQKLSNHYSAALNAQPALKDDFKRVQGLENKAADFYVAVTQVGDAVKANKQNVAAGVAELAALNSVCVKLSTVLGLRKGTELLRFDSLDQVTLAHNLEALFERTGHKSVAKELKRARAQVTFVQSNGPALNGKLEQLQTQLNNSVFELESAVFEAKRKLALLNVALPKAAKRRKQKSKAQVEGLVK